jgi:hypothetical protein
MNLFILDQQQISKRELQNINQIAIMKNKKNTIINYIQQLEVMEVLIIFVLILLNLLKQMTKQMY